jgi:hypothetical protein
MTTDTETRALMTEVVIQLTSGKTWSVKAEANDARISDFIDELVARLSDRHIGRAPGMVEFVSDDGMRTIVPVAHVEGLIVYPMFVDTGQTE